MNLTNQIQLWKSSRASLQGRFKARQKRRQRRLTTAAALALAVLLALPSLHHSVAPIARAASFVVNDAGDAADATPGDGICATAGGVCTLRAAIGEANALAGADDITFDAALDGTPIVLTGVGDNNNATGDFDIRDDLTITGNGIANTLIDGGNSDRVFHVPTNGTDVIFAMLTIQNGRTTVDGGGLFFSGNGTITVNDSLITNNQAPTAGEDGGGVANGNIGIININTTTISGNSAADSGGGIFSSSNGTINITDSTVSGNTANDQGGGIYSDSTTNITNSTISGNDATNDGGGLAADFASANVTLNHVTISNNTAGNGGGMFRNNGTVTVQNSIIAGNTGTNPDCSGTFVSGQPTNRNLVQDVTGCTGFTGIDITGQNPQLGGLANNGGTTETHALLAGSPAIDATANGVGICDRPDQIGQALFDVPGVLSDCDLGAFEFQTLPNVSIADSAATESSGSMTFTVSLDATIPTTVTVQYDTSDGSATAPADYTAQVAQTVDIPPNTASATFTVPIVADAVSEGAETFTVTLSNPVWANIGTGTATGTINESVPSLTISPSSSASITEGNSGTQPLVFNLQLSAPVPSGQTATVDFSAGGGTATGGTDFSPTSGTVTFTAGQDSQTITINITGDTSDEGSGETFTLSLSNPNNLTIAAGNNSVAVTIIDDDTSGSGSSGGGRNDDDDGGSSSPPPPPPAAPPAPAAAAPAPAEAPLPVATLPDTGIDGSSQTRSWLIMMGLGLAGAVLIWRVQRKRQAQDLAEQPLPPPQVDQELADQDPADQDPADQDPTSPDSQ